MATTTISGQGMVQDTTITGATNNNYGNLVYNNCYWQSNGVTFRELMKIQTSAIPSGLILGMRLNMYSQYFTDFVLENVYIYLIKDANTWVEGTSGGGIQAGSACWNYCKYNTQNWAGSVGCSTSGTDYFADA